VIVHDGPYWLFEIEEFQGKPIVHLTCKHMCKTALKEAGRIWSAYRREHPEDHYALQSSPGDALLFKKFALRFGWQPTGILVPLENGQQRELFIHHGQRQPSSNATDGDATGSEQPAANAMATS
jgi:hypothetical protein